MSNKSSKKNEKILNVPLTPRIRKLLDECAEENGRAANREAANIIERDVTQRKAK